MPRPTLLPILPLTLRSTLTAQPRGRVIWQSGGNDGIYSTIAVPDVDGDSSPDAVGAIYYSATPSDPRKVYCLSGRTGDTIWVNRTSYGTWGNKELDVTPDLNRDGSSDILLGTAGGYTTPGRSVTALNGRTGDGHPEVLVGLQDHESVADHFFCLDGLPPSSLSKSPEGFSPPSQPAAAWLPTRRSCCWPSLTRLVSGSESSMLWADLRLVRSPVSARACRCRFRSAPQVRPEARISLNSCSTTVAAQQPSSQSRETDFNQGFELNPKGTTRWN